MRTHFSQKNNRGAVLLIAVLMTSVVLSVGMGIYERTYKSLVFSSYWEQTQIAFAAADAGFECALYLDTHPTAESKCFNMEILTWDRTLLPPYTANVALETPGGGCVKIIIQKPSLTINPATSLAYSTYIEARGYNDSCGSENPRRVERGLKIDY
jgi:hypothetical protein